jgi:hypothetical protein
MIRTALEFIQNELNFYIQKKDPENYGSKEIASLGSIVKEDGSFNFDSSNTDDHAIIITIANIEECRIPDVQSYTVKDENNQIQQVNPAIHLILYIMFSAYSDDYKSSIRNLSYVVSFFQNNYVFTTEKYPHLNALAEKPWQKIQKLIFTHNALSFEQQNNLWGSLGAKYLPSVIYKMRVLTFQEKEVKTEAPPITQAMLTDSVK